MDEGNAVLRNMTTKEQSAVPVEDIVEKLKSILSAS
jgi:histidyl-tRNA synthetase